MTKLTRENVIKSIEYGNNDLSKAMIIIEIENYMYHANFRIDKEINIMALLASVLKIINQQ
jgi:hypothetical protein